MNKHYDYIIVGAGSAGCVLANRLTENGKAQVLLLEKGGSDRHLYIQMPTALSYPMNMDKFTWKFQSQAEPALNNRSLYCPRGKVLGGTSSINGMVYVRGHACDFDEWQQLGADDWSYQNCLPYFKKAENWSGGADDYRGGDGPLTTCNGNKMVLNPLYQVFINAGKEAGYPITSDYNGYQQEGFGPMHMTVKDGVRANTTNAYLSEAKNRDNLTVITNVMSQKILLDGEKSGKIKATGIEYKQHGKTQQVYAGIEVILSAGSIGSPVLLQFSGIGPRQVLDAAGVETVHHLPGVGENLQDHLEVYFQYHCKQPITLNSKLGLLSKAAIGARWMLFKDGLGATNHFESCAFIRSQAGKQWPDIQYHFLPAAMRYDGGSAVDGHGFQVHVGPNKPSSRGRVRISSTDTLMPPNILFNYLSSADDVESWRRCIRLTREIINQPGFDSYRGGVIQPDESIQSDEDIDAWVRENVESAYHPSCTCKMGAAEDALAVLDAQCRVRGIDALRVVDSSIFPTITNGNLNAPTIMAAEKVADMILGKPPLALENVDVWIDQNWQTQQRSGSPERKS